MSEPRLMFHLYPGEWLVKCHCGLGLVLTDDAPKNDPMGKSTVQTCSCGRNWQIQHDPWAGSGRSASW